MSANSDPAIWPLSHRTNPALLSMPDRLAAGKALRQTIKRSAFAEAYADQTERDYDRLVAAAKHGHIAVDYENKML